MVTKHQSDIPVQEDILVAGHCFGYAVIQNEEGELGCVEDPEKILKAGELYIGKMNTNLLFLPDENQKYIYDLFGNEVE